MKLLVLTDLHGRTGVIEKILASAGAFDAIVFSGDLTDFGNAEKAKEVLAALKKSGKPVFAIPGNCDPLEVVTTLDGSGAAIHKIKKEFRGFVFAGFGGSNKTPFGTPLEMAEEAIEAGIRAACGDKPKNLILITHAPPKNTPLDTLPGGIHVGSTAVREAIEKYNPDFLFCGHVHESIGKEKIGKTIVVNPGPARAGKYCIVDPVKKTVVLKAVGGVS